MGAVGNYEVVAQAFSFVSGASVTTIEVPIPVGKVGLGGGVDNLIDSGPMFINDFPHPAGDRWVFRLRPSSTTSATYDGTLYVTVAEMGGC
jgi:hypothetical protein